MATTKKYKSGDVVLVVKKGGKEFKLTPVALKTFSLKGAEIVSGEKYYTEKYGK